MKPISRIKKLSYPLLRALIVSTALQTCYGASGDLDLSFDPGSRINNGVDAVALQNDGKILIAGSFTTVHGAIRNGIARLNTDGSVDTNFLNGLAGAVYTSATTSMEISHIAVQSDGKINVSGYFTAFNGSTITNIARLNPDGSLASSLNLKLGYADLVQLQTQPDGKILVLGAWGSVNGVNLARFNVDGTQDSSFNAAIVGSWQHVDELGLQSDGRMVVVGPAGPGISGVVQGTTLVARLNGNGSADNSFQVSIAPFAAYSIECAAVQSDDKILLGGRFQSVDGVARNRLCRLNADGSLDTSFLNGLSGADNYVIGLAVQSDGKILIGGEFSSVNGIQRSRVARLNADGSLDTSFLNGMAGVDGLGVYTLAEQSDGKILITGSFSSVNGISRQGFARLNADGSLDSLFPSGRSGPNDTINALAVQNDGKVLVAGSFSSIDGMAQTNLARLNIDGSLDSSIAISLTGGGYPGPAPIQCVELQSDDKILIGGSFTSINGASCNGIARLNPNGSLDNTFNASVGGAYYSQYAQVDNIGLQNDGKILIAGLFTQVNGVALTNFARLNVDGSLDTNFDTPISTSDEVTAFAVQADGKILIAGYPFPSNGILQKGIVRLQADGSLDGSFFNGQTGVVGQAYSVTCQSDGKILVAGVLTTVDGVARTGITRLNSDGSLDNSFNDGLAGAVYGVMRVALQDDGKILAALRYYYTTNALYPTNMVRLNTDGTIDNSFLGGQSGPNNAPSSIVVQADGRIMIGGGFSSVNQIPRNCVARLLGKFAPPIISTDPQTATAEAGAGFSFAMHVTGYPPPTYQWFFNGTNQLETCTNQSLELSDVAFSGTYTLVSSNACGLATSAPLTLNVIPRVDRRPVPAINLIAAMGSILNVEYADRLDSAGNWLPLATMTASGTPQSYFDQSTLLPTQRFYRVRPMEATETTPIQVLNLNFVPAITLAGSIGDSLELDYINVIGPTNAWMNLTTVTLTNATQLYFDVTARGQPERLYRVLSVP